ncbi:MAG: TatD family hydrolase [Bacteroidia bacterium]|nr:TatD family hydrolase [Bacteroidia bacterium]
MKLIDTHSHLYLDVFREDRDAVLARAREVLETIFLPNINTASIPAVDELAAYAPGFCLPMMGLHPCDVREGFEQELEQIYRHLTAPGRRYYGIGETGLDLYWDQTTLPLQQEALRTQIQWAKALDLPIILHARDAIDETTDLIAAAHDSRLRGIFHCFDGTAEQAARILEFGSFKLGIGGIVTYRKDVQAVVRDLPLASIVLETDSPYLPPEPHRKDKRRRNESSYTVYVARQIAALKDLPEEAVAAATTAAAREVFPAWTPAAL